jgi:predicted O-methyltransferase YrrM
MQEMWNAVEEYVTALVIRPDDALQFAVRASEEAGLPPIQVAPGDGKLLHLLARSIRARAILEIGTLGGYSAIWLARALEPGGKVVTMEIDARHAGVARRSIANAGLSGVVDIRVGAALDLLPQLESEGQNRFDLVFIDADKANIPGYFAWALKLTHAGSLVVVDNVVREGTVLNAASDDPAVQGVRRFNEMLAAEPRVSATTLQTVGSKGYDGFTLVLVGVVTGG